MQLTKVLEQHASFFELIINFDAALFQSLLERQQRYLQLLAKDLRCVGRPPLR